MPYCAEQIQDDAIKCRYCGSDLRQHVVTVDVQRRDRPGCGGIMAIIAAVPFALMWAMVAPDSFGGMATGLGMVLLAIAVLTLVPPDRLPQGIRRPTRGQAVMLAVVGLAFILAASADLGVGQPVVSPAPAETTQTAPAAPSAPQLTVQQCLQIGHAMVPALVTGKASDGLTLYDARFDEYRYRWAERAGCVAAVFQPRRLPRNDDVVIPGMRHVVTAAFGVDVGRAEPKLLMRGEVNTIEFASGEERFEVTTIKEDTGEPHTIVAWRTAGASGRRQ